MTLSDSEPQFQGHSKVWRRISRERCIRSTLCLVLGYGFRDRRIEWRYLRFDKIQDGGWRPSRNDGAVARIPCVSWAFLLTNDMPTPLLPVRITFAPESFLATLFVYFKVIQIQCPMTYDGFRPKFVHTDRNVLDAIPPYRTLLLQRQYNVIVISVIISDVIVEHRPVHMWRHSYKYRRGLAQHCMPFAQCQGNYFKIRDGLSIGNKVTNVCAKYVTIDCLLTKP